MAISARAGISAPGPWWSIPQTIVWIFSRNETEAAANHPTVASLQQLLPGLIPFATEDKPPLSLNDACAELMRAAKAREIDISGERGGVRALVPMHELNAPALVENTLLPDGNGMYVCVPSIIEKRQALQPDSGRFWVHLWMRADDCMKRWPPRRDASRRNAGAKPTKRETAKAYLLQTYPPKGILPATLKIDSVLQDIKAATDVSMDAKTLRDARRELDQDSQSK
jgi:hypothetical protein